MLKTMTIAIAAAAMLLPAARAMEQSDSKLTEELLRQAIAKESGEARKNGVAFIRKGKVKIDGQVRRAGTFTLPLRCSASIHYFDGTSSHEERKDEEVVFTGDIGTCAVRIPFRWELHDDTGLMDVTVRLTNDLSAPTRKKVDAGMIFRSTYVPLDGIALPAEGQTATISFDAAM